MYRLLLPLLLVASEALAQKGPPPRPTVSILSTDASLVAAQTDDTIYVWDRRSGKRRGRVRNRGFFRGALAPGALVAVSDSGVTVWRGATYDEPVKLAVPKVLSMGRTAISRDGRVVAAIFAGDGGGGAPDTVGVWDARSGALRGRVTLAGARVQGTVLSDDGRWLAIYADRPGAKGALLQVHALGGRSLRKPLFRWQSVADRTTYCAAFAPPPQRKLALCAGHRLLLWDLDRRKIVARAQTKAIAALFPAELRGALSEMPGAHGVAFSPDGRELLTLHGFRVVGVARWSTAPLRPTGWIKRPLVGGTMRQVAWDHAGGIWLVTSGYSPKVTLHQPRAGRFAPVRVLKPR
jgi:hypothetical protein